MKTSKLILAIAATMFSTSALAENIYQPGKFGTSPTAKQMEETREQNLANLIVVKAFSATIKREAETSRLPKARPAQTGN